MAQWLKADRELSLYVNLDHIIYMIVFKNVPEEEGVITYQVRGALISSPKEEIIFKSFNTKEEAEACMRYIMGITSPEEIVQDQEIHQ